MEAKSTRNRANKDGDKEDAREQRQRGTGGKRDSDKKGKGPRQHQGASGQRDNTCREV